MFSPVPIIWLQSLGGPAATAFMQAVSILGTQPFYMLALPILYWSWDRRRGLRLAALFLLSMLINLALKAAFGLPRPYQFDAAVQQLALESSPGFPSGHAQGATVLFGGLAAMIGGAAPAAAAAVLVGLICLSRLYLGAHFVGDVTGGVLIGLPFVLAARLLAGRTDFRPARPAVVAAGLALAGAALAYLPHPQVAATAGTLAGFALGWALERRWVRHRIAGPSWQRALRSLAGFVLVAPVLAGLRLATPDGLLWREARYLALTAVAVAAVPWLLARCGLASRPDDGGDPAPLSGDSPGAV